MRTLLIALLLASGPVAAQVTCNQVGNMTYCNGQLQQTQSNSTFNWLPYLQTPNIGQAYQQQRQAALQNQLLQEQIRAQQLQNQQATVGLDTSTLSDSAAPAPTVAPSPSASTAPIDTVASYTTGSRDSYAITYYLEGVQDAYAFANADLVVHHQQPIYCQPETLSLNVENLRNFIDDGLAAMSEDERKDVQSYPISIILLSSLKKTFPCPPTVLKHPTNRDKN